MQFLGSDAFGLAKSDWQSIGKGMLVAAVGAALTWLANIGIPYLQQQPESNLMLCVILSTAVNTARKWITDTTKEVVPKEADPK